MCESRIRVGRRGAAGAGRAGVWVGLIALGWLAAPAGCTEPADVADGNDGDVRWVEGDVRPDDAAADDGTGQDADALPECNMAIDVDSDTIHDDDEGEHEGVDTDGDTIPDFRDRDSDDDGFPDIEEAGDDDCHTAPRDTDGDTIPDFRDTDSDGDGMLDADEPAAGTDPLDPDSDDDGWEDLIEAIHPVADPTDPERGVPEEDWVVTLPAGGDVRFAADLEVTSPGGLDVFLLVDGTSSMDDARAALESALIADIVPALRALLPDTAFGIGEVADFPTGSYGDYDTDPFVLRQPVTLDDEALAAGFDGMGTHGADWAEAQVEALYQTATGEGLGTWVPTYATPGCVGAACFRPGARPVIVLFTDAPFHNGPPGTVGEPYTGIRPEPHTWEQAVAAVAGIGARVVGMCASSEGPASAAWHDLEATVVATGATAAGGEPLVYDVGRDGAAVADAVVAAVPAVSGDMIYDVDTIVESAPAVPPCLAASCFIQSIRPATWFGPTGMERDPEAVVGMDDSTFYAVRPGARVVFAVRLANTWCCPAIDRPQVLLATIVVRGDGLIRLAARRIVIIVPAW